MDTLKTTVADHIAKQKDAIAKQKAGLYDLQVGTTQTGNLAVSILEAQS